MSDILQLSSLSLPSSLGLRRDPPPRSRVLQKSFWDHYDSTTLIYDATRAEDGTVALLAPKLFNLRPMLEQALEPLSGQIDGPVRWRYGRHIDSICFRLRAAGQVLPLRIGANTYDLVLNPVETERFRGLDVIYTLSKDNDLIWIRDWLAYHHNAHGATGAVIADNGSTRYSPRELLAAMQSVPGYREVAVVSAELPFGPSPRECTRVSRAEFLQAGLLNILRDRLFSNARTMLVVDIDELVVGRDGQSVFDATANSLLGFITFTGQWRYTQRKNSPVRHHDHVWEGRRQEICPTKYCIRPKSLLGRRDLTVHSVANVNRNLFRSKRNFHYLHLRHISTSWKYDRTKNLPENLVHDAETERLFSSYLGDSVRSKAEGETT